MKVLIIEDDYKFSCMLKNDLTKFMSNYVSRTYFYICRKDYLNECQQHQNYDIAFIDIQLNGKDLGIHLAKKILSKNKMIPIVFVTSRDNLMHDTFAVQPFYHIRKSNYKEDFLVFCKLFEKQLHSKNYITLSYDHNKSPILISNICYAEIGDQVLYVHTDDRVYKDTRSLKKFLKEISHDTIFIQINKYFIVNAKYVYTYNKEKVVLVNGLEIKFGRRFSKEFEKKYREFLLK